MSLLNIWWAAGAAALVIPVLVLLYFLKLRRRDQPVSSTLLWKRSVQDLRANVPFQRLRRNLLLALQLLILLLLLVALARPVLEAPTAVKGRLVIIIDRSASMNAWEGSQTRLDLAKEQAVELLRTLNRPAGGLRSLLRFDRGPAAHAMVIAFADRATVVSPFSPNRSELIEAVQRIEPTDGATNIREALELAQAYLTPAAPDADETATVRTAPARLVLFSDGAIGQAEELDRFSGQLELVSIGSTCDNVGITALRAQRDYEQPNLVRAFVQVQNFSDKPVVTTLALYVDGVLADVPIRELALGPASQQHLAGSPEAAQKPSTTSVSFELLLSRSAVLEARLSRPDALSADNRAWAVVPPPRRLRVLVVTHSNFLLDSVLSGLPLEERAFVTPQQFEVRVRHMLKADGYPDYDVVIFDKYQPDELPAGNYIFLGVVPPIEGFGASGRTDQVEPLIWWDETHPILRHVILDDLFIAQSIVLAVPADAVILAEGPSGPALVLHRKHGRCCLVLSFAVEQSTWWDKPAYPIFMYNVLHYLAGADAGSRLPLRPGDMLRYSLPPEARDVRIVRPDGTEAQPTVDAEGTATYADTRQVGLYRLICRSRGRRFEEVQAANLEDPRESDIRPRSAAELASPQVVAGQTLKREKSEVWRYLVAAALGLLMLEWYVYTRRMRV